MRTSKSTNREGFQLDRLIVDTVHLLLQQPNLVIAINPGPRDDNNKGQANNNVSIYKRPTECGMQKGNRGGL